MVSSVQDFFEKVNAVKRRLPMRIQTELTYRCNFECPHCFCRLPVNAPDQGMELRASEWIRILGEAAEEGVVFLTITGGEPLLHEGFREIWVAAKRLGLIPDLFTNGSLITEEVADFLAEWPPSVVSMTLYAASEPCYEKMTGRGGMFEKVVEAADLLKKRGIPVEMKGLFSRLNKQEFEGVREISARYSAAFRWDAELVGCGESGGGRPESVRLSPEEIIELERKDPDRWSEWGEYLSPWKPEPPDESSHFRCLVGRNSFSVNPYGRLGACLLLGGPGYDLSTGTVREGWYRAVPEFLECYEAPSGPCQRCDLISVCRVCPAIAVRQGQSASWPVRFRCDLARLRASLFALPALPACELIEGGT